MAGETFKVRLKVKRGDVTSGSPVPETEGEMKKRVSVSYQMYSG